MSALVFPMFVYVFYVISIIIANFFIRLNSIKKGEASAFYYKNYKDKGSMPERLIILERHIDNQFQVPTVFLITCLSQLVLIEPNTLSICLAWAFVLSRFLHTFIHLGRNKIIQRAAVYGLGGIIILSMWVQILCSGFQQNFK